MLAEPIGRLTDKVLEKPGGARSFRLDDALTLLSAADHHEMRKGLKTMRYAVGVPGILEGPRHVW